MSITVGLIGLGNILPNHLAALKTAPEFTIASVCDAAPEKARRWGHELGCRAFVDWRQLLQRPPDLAVVALPHGLHCQVSVAALHAGCHVLVEKPMAVSVAECNEMLRAAAECDRRLLVAEGASYDPGAVLTGRRLADGGLGAFFTGASINERFYFRESRPEWFLDPAMSGGGMFANVGVHRLALARAALPGLTPVSVSASVSRAPERPVEACTSLIVRYAEGGSMLYEEVGYYERPHWLNVGRHFVFERGIVAWDDTTWHMIKRDGSQLAEPLASREEPYASVYADVLCAIRGLGSPANAEGNALDVAVVQAAYASARNGRELNLTASEWRVVPPECLLL